MANKKELTKVKINEGYELYQIIKDFGEPLEIFREAFQNAIDEDAKAVYCHVHTKKELDGETLFIDIWNDGNPLKEENVQNFFGLAYSSKITDAKLPVGGKLGYKGHGSKIFFNAECVQICSKDGPKEWYAELKDPLTQIKNKDTLEYTEPMPTTNDTIRLPKSINKGFFVRIINPKHFPNQETQYKLDHRYLRDYALWYTVFGTVRTLYDENLKNKDIKLYLAGLDVAIFKGNVGSQSILIDPTPVFEDVDGVLYEKIPLGHIFPEERTTERQMKVYCNSIDSKKNYYDFYASRIVKKNRQCAGITSYTFVMSLEGYETKRMYDLLLSRKGRQQPEMKKLAHTDAERYGFWVCKGGVPIEKVDDWIEGGKGSYTYLQAFIDCDDFELTANRGSVRNTAIEIIKAIKDDVNAILKDSDVEKIFAERTEAEEQEKLRRSLDDDKKDLKKRKQLFEQRKKFTDEDGFVFYEPSLTSKNVRSESETLILLVQLMARYPSLFDFELLDYNTTKGIDFVVRNRTGEVRYIELKGILTNTMNHPFECIDRIICFETDLTDGEICRDLLENEVRFEKKPGQTYKSKAEDDGFTGKQYTGFQFVPEQTNSNIKSIEVICLKEIVESVLGGQFQ